jgi:hypothetical protein
LEPVETADLRVNPVNPRAVHLREERLRAMEVADRLRVMVEAARLADRPRDMAVAGVEDHHRDMEVARLVDHHRATVVAARLADHHRVTVAAWVLAVAWVLVAGRCERRSLESCPRQSTSLFGFMTLRPSPIGFTDTGCGC